MPSEGCVAATCNELKLSNVEMSCENDIFRSNHEHIGEICALNFLLRSTRAALMFNVCLDLYVLSTIHREISEKRFRSVPSFRYVMLRKHEAMYSFSTAFGLGSDYMAGDLRTSQPPSLQ